MFEKIKSQLAIKDFCEMDASIALWGDMYEGNAPWLSSKVKSLNLPVAIACEIARLVMLEMKSSVSGSHRADYINVSYSQLINRLRTDLEIGCARGGLVFKPYLSENGIVIESIPADRFIPTHFDAAGKLTGAIFIEQISLSGNIYTRTEEHLFENGLYTVKNHAFYSKNSSGLGAEIPLTKVAQWKNIEQEVVIENLNAPLFAYFKVPLANQVDSQSPIGVSCYSRAVDLIKMADEQYSRLLWEFEGAELAVDASSDVIKFAADGARLPKLSERLFRRLETQDPDFYRVFNPEIRDESLSRGLNTILRKIEFNCGLSYGTISDVQFTQRTAQEILDSKQRSYVTICDYQKALQVALEDLIGCLDDFVDLYALVGAGKIESIFEFDDSILSDRNSEFEERLKLVEMGLLRPEMMNAWYFGCSESIGLEMMAKEKNENV